MVPLSNSEDAQFDAALDVRLDVPVARIGTRALAQGVDVLLLLVIQLVALGLMGLVWYFLPSELKVFLVGAYLLFAFTLQWGWEAAWEVAWDGQTPGKRLVGIRVVAEDGTSATTQALLIRNLLRPVDYLPVSHLLGIALIVLHPRSRRVGDLAAGTVVVVEPEALGAQRRYPAGLGAGDHALVDRFFAQAWALSPERRRELAELLLVRLARTDPALGPDGSDPVARLHALFPEDR